MSEDMRVTIGQNSLWRAVSSPIPESCTCGQWMVHWKLYSRSAVPAHCGYDGCDEGPPYYGAHMQNAVHPAVIVPVCRVHYKRAATNYGVMRACIGVIAKPGPLC
jgi:hypothetical protein